MAITRALSIEDGNLETSLISDREIKYSDIDLSFEAKPSGDVYKKLDAAAVKQAVKTVLLTNRFDKPFRPSFGADLQGLLFDLADPLIENDIRDKIIANIQAYEPRARIITLDVRVRPDNHEVNVTITFEIVSTREKITITTSVSRLR